MQGKETTMYRLVGEDRKEYFSEKPGTFGGKTEDIWKVGLSIGFINNQKIFGEL